MKTLQPVQLEEDVAMVEYTSKVLDEKESRFYANCECAVAAARSAETALPRILLAERLNVKLSSWKRCTRTVPSLLALTRLPHPLD